MSDQPTIVITGLGINTPYGSGIDPILRGIAAGRPAYGPLSAIDCRTWPVRCGGWLDDPSPEALGMFNNKLRNMGKYVRLGVLTARQALDAAGLASGSYEPERFGAFICTGTHGHNAEGLFPAFAAARDAQDRLDLAAMGRDGLDRVHPWWLLSTISNNLIFFLTQFFQLKGANTNCCNSAIAGAHALDRALESLRHGEIDLALVGGADAPLNWQLLSDFSVLGFAAEGDPESCVPMKPFSAEARGPVLSDGAAFLVLETAAHAARRGAAPLAAVERVRLAGENLDAVLPPEDGSDIARVLGQSFEDLHRWRASVGRPDVGSGQIITSAVGIPAWDWAELSGINQVLEERHAAGKTPGEGLPALGAIKPWIGHTYSASFVAEAAVAAAALKAGIGLPASGPAEHLYGGPGSAPDARPGATSATDTSVPDNRADVAAFDRPWTVPTPVLPHDWSILLGRCFGGNAAGVLLHVV